MRHGIVALVALFAATSCIIGNAFYQKKQFFPAVIYLAKYRPFFAVILAQCLTFLVMIAKCICWLFFGTLQRSEVDNILSRAWYTFFDMCLVFAFFQDELNTKFMFLFTIILFVKTFHWLLEERIENMERTPTGRSWSRPSQVDLQTPENGTVPFPCLSPLMPTPPADLAQPPDEARLRASVEARVALLQQVQTLLDAAVLQMNAYLAVVSHPSLVLPNSHPPRSTSTLVPSSAMDSTKEKSPAKVECATEEEVSTTAKTPSVNPDLAGDDLDVLRKHRLEKLSPKHPADEPTVSPEIKDTAKESDKPPDDLPKTN
nr:unnamed protein product [Spirometra erinaceieuropaei]